MEPEPGDPQLDPSRTLPVPGNSAWFGTEQSRPLTQGSNQTVFLESHLTEGRCGTVRTVLSASGGHRTVRPPCGTIPGTISQTKSIGSPKQGTNPREPPSQRWPTLARDGGLIHSSQPRAAPTWTLSMRHPSQKTPARFARPGAARALDLEPGGGGCGSDDDPAHCPPPASCSGAASGGSSLRPAPPPLGSSAGLLPTPALGHTTAGGAVSRGEGQWF